ncbi:MAG: DMT family transporter [Oscillospiraceae bacterium]|nr:DMT family transporter [Oscillospiraceae bacterium]
MNRKTKQIVLPLIAAMIWGSAFVAQKSGAEVLGAFTFTGTRYLLAALALVCFLLIRGKYTRQRPFSANRSALLRGGLVMGTLLAVASNLQQYGVGLTSAGKAGFITTLYIVLVPLFGLFLHKRVRVPVWCGVAVALAGLYLLSFAAGGEMSFTMGDLCVLLCAIVFSCHILAVDYFTKFADAVELACLQFVVAAVESLLCALVTEGVAVDAIRAAAFPIFYAGVISGGIAYTLQIVSQKDGDPAVVSLLLSLESFFAALSGAIILHERLSLREYFGCALMLCAVVLVQLPEKKAS